MQFTRNPLVLSCVVLLVIAWQAPADGAIIGTYVDADPGPAGNTVRTSDGNTGAWVGLAADQWNNRTNTPPTEFGDILENDASTTQSAPEIATTIAGLNPGLVYKIYIIYQTVNTTAGGSATATGPGRDWHVNAGLSAGSLTRYDSTNGVYTGTNGGTAPLIINEREALLGQFSAVSSVSVFVNDDLSVAGLDNRTRYDGVAYDAVAVAPEPASSLAAAVVSTILLLKRKSARPSRRRT